MRKLREHVEEAILPIHHLKEIKYYLSGLSDENI